jgi:hypothetical protein
VAGLTVRSTTLAGWAGIVLVGALVPLVAVLLAGGEERLVWVVVAGAGACASGLTFGMTQRILPALAFAVVAGGALVMAATTDEEQAPVRELAYPARGEVASEQERSRGNASESEPRTTRRARPTPREFVRDYYAAIESGRYQGAWSRLSAAGDAQSFEDWRAGYATTVSQRVEDVETEPGGVVRYVLVAVDLTPCGTTTERRFEVRWRLVPSGRSYTATSLGAVKLDGIDPVAACW